MQPNVGCVLCGNSQQLFRCARCRNVLYCSKEHQKLHWRVHKPQCFNANSETGISSPNFATLASEEQGRYVMSNAYARGGAESSEAGAQMYQQSAWDQSGWQKEQNPQTQPNQASFMNVQDSELISAIDTLFSDQNPGSMPFREDRKAYDPNFFMNNPSSVQPQQPFVDSFQHNLVMKKNAAEWMLQVCQFVIRDLDKYGICVIDDFLGKEHGEAILGTTEDLYDSGVFRDGEVVSNKWRQSTRTIRGDQITWVDGTEPGAQSISYLIAMVDSVIMHAKRIKNNGCMANHVIQGRTKAMVACYPGNGTHYVKHIDNPNRDGRCITTIYYLNKDWHCKEDGGLLRIFPTGWANQVADIEPLFDRMLFFWSDRRNPHEVQPAFRTRYAITLWYFDAEEREEARLRYQRETAARMSQGLPQPMNIG